MAWKRSLCSTLVGNPVLGPPRWILQIMSGISAMDAQPIASPLSEIPGPALPVTARYPEYEQPSAIETEASSSSACTKMPPYFGSSRRRVSIMDDQGVIG